MSMKQMALRHAGACRVCGVELAAKAVAVYDFTAKNVVCLGCVAGESAGSHSAAATPAGESASAGFVSRRVHERRAGDRRQTTSTS
jgi:hypothetical protein